VAEAAARYGDALGRDPWLESWPVTLSRVIPTPDEASGGWQLADSEDELERPDPAGADSERLAVPITPKAAAGPGLWRLAALSGGAPVTVFGECGHRGFTPLTAWPEGPGEAVALC
jgi:hypothetical protein